MIRHFTSCLFGALGLCTMQLSAQTSLQAGQGRADMLRILGQAREKAEAVRFVDYRMRFDMKFMTQNDTVTRYYQTRFLRQPADTLFGGHFRYDQTERVGKPQATIAYNGQAVYSAYNFDSSLQIDRLPQDAGRINSYIHNFQLYQGFSATENPIPHDTAMANDTLAYLGVEEVLGEKCHRIHLHRQVKADTSAGSTMRVLGYQQEFWISTGATTPMPLLAYSHHTRLAIQGDTMQQYQGFRLEEYKVYPNTPAGGIDTGFNPIFRYKAPKPDEPLPTLANGTEAPDFLLKTLDGTYADLRSFRGKVVLVDFFYRSCYPCMLAIPGLQEMHHHLHDSGLVVLGVNPFDTAGTVLKRFLSGRGVTYPILIDADKSVVNTWKVRAYPTLYLIDRRGNIRYNQIGYSKETEEGIRVKVKELLQEAAP
jgi:peroxiredoxin